MGLNFSGVRVFFFSLGKPIVPGDNGIRSQTFKTSALGPMVTLEGAQLWDRCCSLGLSMQYTRADFAT